MKIFPTTCIRIQIQEGQYGPKKYENLSFVELDVLLWKARASPEVYLAIHRGFEGNT
jgi:hypothetical protein